MASPEKYTTRELISFCIADQYFCIDVSAVREIRGWTTVTPLPHAPSELRGVVNLRGAILPIMDLSMQLGLPTTEPTKQDVIILVTAHGHTVGMRVDGVSDIISITADQVQPPPAVAINPNGLVEGLIEVDGRLLTLLRIKHLIPEPMVAEFAEL